jgi:hypothetical protein
MDSSGSSVGSAVVHIRNIGKSTITVDTIYVEGTSCTFTALTINEGEVGQTTITEPSGSAWGSGKTHDVKVIAEDNTQLSFTIKAN